MQRSGAKAAIGTRIRIIADPNRAEIEQAKGMLMLVYGVNADRAFEVLRWRSQQENVKIRDVAAALVDEIQAGMTIEEHHRRRLDEIVLRPRRSSEASSSQASRIPRATCRGRGSGGFLTRSTRVRRATRRG